MIVTHRAVQYLIQRPVTTTSDDARFLAARLSLPCELRRQSLAVPDGSRAVYFNCDTCLF